MARSLSLLVAAVALATAPFVHAADAATDATATVAMEVALPAPTITLKALFAASATEEVIDVVDGVAFGMEAMEVMVARIDPDGRVLTACVDSEKAARAFLDAPVDKVATKTAKEQ
jgi:hypothetical protein